MDVYGSDVGNETRRVLEVALTIVLVATVPACVSPGGGSDSGAEQNAGASSERASVAVADPGHAYGQTLYVPVYSHIYYREATRKIDLTATLSVRNTDPDDAITVSRVDYYDSDGRYVRGYADPPFLLGSLATRSFVVDELDRSGGSGANFIVEWSANEPVSDPVVEAVMISVASSSGISFVMRARVIEERLPSEASDEGEPDGDGQP